VPVRLVTAGFDLGGGVRLEAASAQLALVNQLGRVLWHSRHRFRIGEGPGTLDAAALRGHLLAFSTYHGSAWVAHIPAAERVVAPREDVVLWTTHGQLVTTSFGQADQTTAYSLRAADGRLIRVITHGTGGYTPDPTAGTLLAVRQGRLIATDGTATHTIASLRGIGAPSGDGINPLPNSQVAVTTQRRMAILERDGRVVASTPLAQPTSGLLAALISSEGGLTANPSGTLAAFAQTTKHGSTCNSRIVILGRQAPRGLLAFTHTLPCPIGEQQGCELTWHGDWILQGDWSGQAWAIDTRNHHAINLTATIHQLAPTPESRAIAARYASWAT
jgi:hypothetical protein